MRTWSVVIPTIWKSNYIHQQLVEYVKSELIREIILIDNTRQYFDFYDKKLDKLILIQPETNLFVNPSWNLGVETSKSNNIIIANDDIVWDISQLNKFDDGIFKDFNVLGQSPSNFKNGKNLKQIKEIEKENLTYNPLEGSRPHGWGCLLFTQKNLWKPIPDELKIWFGDDWIIYKSKLTTGTIKNLCIGGEKNASESEGNFPIRMRDHHLYTKLGGL